MSKKQKILQKIKVLDTAAKGRSMAKASDGRVIFITGAVPGDIVDIQLRKKRKSYYEGKVVKIISKSSFRVDPKCNHFQICGGCSWQNMDYENQIKFKQKEVQSNLERIGGVKPAITKPIKKAKKEYFYRNKLEFSFSNSRWLTNDEIKSSKTFSDKNALGFHIPGMWNKVIDIEKCWLQKNPSNRIRNYIKDYSKKIGLTYFDYKNNSGDLRSMMVRTSTTGEVMLLIQFYNKTKLINNLLDSLINEFPNITSLLYVINKKANDTLYDQKINCHYGNDHIFEQIDGLNFKIYAKSFYQTNSQQTKILYNIVKKMANIKPNEVIYDLYSGIGTISIFLAENAKKIIGIESVEDAVKAAKENVKLNSINNVSFYNGEIRKVLNDDFLANNGIPDTIIVDPPRSGIHKKVVDKLLKILPHKIIYVSCNSATQARDLSLMKEFYTINLSQSVDMFPQTYHVENVVLLKKNNNK
tara:strand:- start:87 stop:1496 length:1410 start_codon:yes stop_codon:yes gene_type:complete